MSVLNILKILKYNKISSKRTSRVKANVSKLVFGKAAMTGTWPGAAASERTVTRAQRSHSFRQQEKIFLCHKKNIFFRQQEKNFLSKWQRFKDNKIFTRMWHTHKGATLSDNKRRICYLIRIDKFKSDLYGSRPMSLSQDLVETYLMWLWLMKIPTQY